MRKLLLLLLCIVVLTGCQGKPLPEGMEEETVLDAGREVVISLVRGEYDAVAEAFREELKDYYGYTDSDINAMGDLLVVEGRSFTAVRVICGIGAALFLLGLVISIFRWRKISAEFRPAKPAAGSVSGPEIE